MSNRTFVVTAIVVAIVGACDVSMGVPGTGSIRSATASAAPTISTVSKVPATAAPASPAVVLPSGLDGEIREAVEFRRSLGLRHDLAYVQATFADPLARISLLDFPMYPDEEAKLLADQADQDVAISAIQAYAADHVDSFGGLYIDRDEFPGVVFSLWTDSLLQHEIALRLAIGGKGLIALRQVRYSEAHLRSLQDAITDDRDWMERDIPAAMQSVGVDTIRNIVTLEVSSKVPEAVDRIKAHYALGDRLEVISDGTGVRFIPFVDVKGRVVMPDGSEPGDLNDLWLDSTSDDPGECGGGDIGYGVMPDGHFTFPCQLGTRTIIVNSSNRDTDGYHEVGRGVVTIVEGKPASLTIHLVKDD